ncbi:SPX domain-containing protein [Thermothelomyces heterothallicus CBS 202.75]|uniref:SPX domain-containing protein n=1 Tax=Thermothelomyces heterothallicus CBS 202.75 TaxID=1149848 RepID=UPI003744713F
MAREPGTGVACKKKKGHRIGGLTRPPRFAKELDQDAVPEWRAKYLNYKAGKKHIKAVTRAINRANATPTLTRKGTEAPQAKTPAAIFGIDHEFTPNRSSTGDPSLFRCKSAADAPGGNERSGLASSPGSALQYGSFGPSPSRQSDRNDFELPAPAMRVPSNTGDPVWHRTPLPRSATMADDAARLGRPSPSLRTFRSRGTAPTPRLRVARLFSTASSAPRQTPNRAEIGLQNLDYVRSAERDFFAFLDSELDKIETFYKEKEDQATERLAALRAQLHEMRNRRTAEIAESRKRREQARSSSRSEEEDADGRPKDGNRAWIGPLKHRFIKPGPNSEELQKMTRTPVMTGQSQTVDVGRDYVRRPQQANDVPYRTAKRKLKLAMQEFHRSLELLKSYALLNRTAFRKLNKKYDKAVNARPPYRYMNEKVNKSWFVNSDILDGHLRTVEDLYARYFEKGNHKIAAGKLRAPQKRQGDSSDSAFRSGLMIGVGSVFAVQGLIYGSEILLGHDEDEDFVEQTGYLLQLYGGYFLVLLLFGLFTLDCRMWSKNKVNYPFIFEFDARNFLDWKQVAEFPSFFFALFGVFLWLNFSRSGNWEELYLYYPVILICISLVIIFLPAPILHHKARRWFLYSHYRLLLSGLYPVEDISSSAIWDLFMDFSLLQANAQQRLLRDITALRPVWIYYVIMVLDPILRFSWIFYAIFTHDTQHSTIVSFMASFAEVVRRGMWTLLRVENEHCANVAQYKAARDTPLPYHLEQFVQRPSLEQAAATAATAGAVGAGAALAPAVDDAGRPTTGAPATPSLRHRPGTAATPAAAAAATATPSSLRPVTAATTAFAPTPRSERAAAPQEVTATALEEGAAAAGAAAAAALARSGTFRRRLSDAVGKRSILQAMAEAHKQDFEKRRPTAAEAGRDDRRAAEEEEDVLGSEDDEMEELKSDEDDDDDDDDDNNEHGANNNDGAGHHHHQHHRQHSLQHHRHHSLQHHRRVHSVGGGGGSGGGGGRGNGGGE